MQMPRTRRHVSRLGACREAVPSDLGRDVGVSPVDRKRQMATEQVHEAVVTKFRKHSWAEAHGRSEDEPSF